MNSPIVDLVKALKNDLDYRITWKANIAMAFKDKWQGAVNFDGPPITSEAIHKIANDAADYFLNNLCQE